MAQKFRSLGMFRLLTDHFPIPREGPHVGPWGEMVLGCTGQYVKMNKRRLPPTLLAVPLAGACLVKLSCVGSALFPAMCLADLSHLASVELFYGLYLWVKSTSFAKLWISWTRGLGVPCFYTFCAYAGLVWVLTSLWRHSGIKSNRVYTSRGTKFVLW